MCVDRFKKKINAHICVHFYRTGSEYAYIRLMQQSNLENYDHINGTTSLGKDLVGYDRRSIN